MTGNTLQNIEQIDSSVWGNAEQSRAISKLATNDEEAMPAIGVRWNAGANVAWMFPVVHHDAGIGTSRPRGFA